MRCQNCGTTKDVQQINYPIGLPTVTLCQPCLSYLTPSPKKDPR